MSAPWPPARRRRGREKESELLGFASVASLSELDVVDADFSRTFGGDRDLRDIRQVDQGVVHGEVAQRDADTRHLRLVDEEAADERMRNAGEAAGRDAEN